jgi:hypothetical protein
MNLGFNKKDRVQNRLSGIKTATRSDSNVPSEPAKVEKGSGRFEPEKQPDQMIGKP